MGPPQIAAGRAVRGQFDADRDALMRLEEEGLGTLGDLAQIRARYPEYLSD